jgi:hypothetical protein
MLDSKMLMAGFLKYLQQYYGLDYNELRQATGLSNVMKVPLFQDRVNPVDEYDAMMTLEEQQMQGDMGMESMGMEGMGDPFGMPMDQGLAADNLNSMFPGPYDPVRM